MTRGQLTPTNAQKSFWNDSWASSVYGVGHYFSGSNGSGGALYRGASWLDGTNSGLFATYLANTSSVMQANIGLRCTTRPTSL
jgi:hypothetical protein